MGVDPGPDPRIISTLRNAGFDPSRVPADSISIGGGWMRFQIDFGRGRRTDLRDRCIPFPLDASDVAPLPVNPGAYEDQDGRIWILLGHGNAWTCPTDGGQIIPEGPMQDTMVRQAGVLTLTRLDTHAEWERHQRTADHTAKPEGSRMLRITGNRHGVTVPSLMTVHAAGVDDEGHQYVIGYRPPTESGTPQREEQIMASGTGTAPSTGMKNPDSGDEDFGKDQHEVDRIVTLSDDEFPHFIETSTVGYLREFAAKAVNVAAEHDRRAHQARRLAERIQTTVARTVGAVPEAEASERVFPGINLPTGLIDA